MPCAAVKIFPWKPYPRQMWQRLARELVQIETPDVRDDWEKKFLWLLSDFKFVPGGRILHAIDNPNKVTALNCYVIPSPHDSLPGIYKTALELAETFKRGGGCGVDISNPSSQRFPRSQRREEFLPGPSR